MSRRHSLDPRLSRSLRWSVRDGVAYSVMTGAAESYLTPFALLLQRAPSRSPSWRRCRRWSAPGCSSCPPGWGVAPGGATPSSWAARLVSARYLARMHDPEAESPPPTEPAPRLRERLGRLRGSPFLRFSLTIAAMQGAVAVASPFFAVHMLRDLRFSYLEFMINTAASVLMQFLTLAAWGRLSDSPGNRLVLVFTGWCIPVVPLLWVVWDDFWWLCAVQAFSGLAWAGFSLSSGNFLYDLRPGRPLAGYMALHAVFGSAAVFAGALAGGYLAARLPTELRVGGIELAWSHAFYGLFVLSALARFAVAGLLVRRVREVRAVRPAGVGALVFRLARHHPVSGVVFELVTAVRKAVRPAPDARRGAPKPR